MKLFNTLLRARRFNSTMRLYTSSFICMIFIETLIAPYMTKAVGLQVATTIIAIYAIAKRVAQLTLPYLEHLTLKQATTYLLLVSILFPLTRVYLLVTDEVLNYVYIVWFIALPHSVVMSIVGIKYDAYLATKPITSIISFSEVQVTEAMVYTVTGLVAGIVSALLYFYSDNLAVYVTIALDVVVLFLIYSARKELSKQTPPDEVGV